MAVNFDKLVLAPPIQQSIIDPITRDPTIGKIFFTKAGCLGCPKAIFHQSGDPQNPFVPATELDLDGAGALPFDIWFYPFEENDETQSELYDLQVKATEGDRLVLERLSWPPSTEFSPTPTEAGNTLNLCPNYEFHSMVNEDIYSITPIPSEVIFAWGAWAINAEKPDASRVTYSSRLLNEGSATDIEQTPLNAVTIRGTNTASVSGFRRLSFPLGHYSAFQGKFIYVSHFLANISNTPSLTIQLLRTIGNDSITSPTVINLGTLEIPSNNLEKVEANITIPDITETGFNADDRVYIVLAAPENVDFQFEITANWYQIVESETTKGVTSRYPLGLSSANAFFNTGNLNCPTTTPSSLYANNNNQSCDGLALTQSLGFTNSILRTGMIEEVLSGGVHQANWGLVLSESENNLIYAGETPLDSGEETVKLARSNRLISVLRNTGLNNKNSFETIKKSADTVEVSLLGGSIFKTDWVSSNPAAITVTKNSGSFPYGLKATKTSASTMSLKYVNNFSVVDGISPDYAYYDLLGSTFPIPQVNNIGNWFGEFPPIAASRPAYGTQAITSTLIPAGGGNGVGLELTYTSPNIGSYVAKFASFSFVDGLTGTRYTSGRYRDFFDVPTRSLNIRARPYNIVDSLGNKRSFSAGAMHIIYSKNTPSSQYITGKQSTVILEIPSSVTTVEQLIDFTVTKFDGTESFDLKTNTLPNHGDNLTISNGLFDYAVIFNEEGQGSASPPSGNFKRIFRVKFSAGQSVESFSDGFILFFNTLMRALPTLSEIGVSERAHISHMINL